MFWHPAMCYKECSGIELWSQRIATRGGRHCGASGDNIMWQLRIFYGEPTRAISVLFYLDYSVGPR